MKTLVTLVFLTTAISCSKPKNEHATPVETTKNEPSQTITAEDVAWATGWHITKFRLSDYTSEATDRVNIFFVDPDGELKQYVTSCCFVEGYSSDSEFRIALRFRTTRENNGVDVKVSDFAGGSTSDFTAIPIHGYTYFSNPKKLTENKIAIGEVLTKNSDGSENTLTIVISFDH